MNYIKQIVLVIFCIFVVHLNLLAQTKEWKIETTDGGKITVKSCISEQTDEYGKNHPLVEFVAMIIDNASMSKCISLLSDISKHKLFMDDTCCLS